jgi:hypothetical protein
VHLSRRCIGALGFIDDDLINGHQLNAQLIETIDIDLDKAGAFERCSLEGMPTLLIDIEKCR